MNELTQLKREFTRSSDFLVALGDQKRQAIIVALLDQAVVKSGLQVTDLVGVTQLSRPAVSHHLKILKEAHLVDYHRIGTKNFYYLTHQTKNIDQLTHLLNHVTEIMQCNQQ
ncbi:ArsR/SmtB family transcription factor [Lactiplantibacillus mudanjiangensis]|uniref:ArsR family transcriptional regulator [Lactobacillus koreensis] n=1 Tax=Lactiplantibacillus mudanjiangensis TaxID=1296538 RepID=A0A660E2C0_9LACO|nr:metalloregulator ArsR/SmtB family transcription factor [Lactiplantibacillus mudanjiangensis]VDG19525.1 ArsR family transcriptional regulator [Lactobacillus koreensis] [Lactiplantibacillus mudanjiangensis]VDG23356.1 ArsR family transcriptional regulator [Lactobacillus koreensis] [Lactiplantibacillus mudanjiangensis]VDG28761.1 ArsR family transcriptional regulator [Lactobacillus koreensis] [Lactiplantibacillus mudanjiangensis]VDG30975.1 ArsR family transcriptional regulator [Lactobacillus kore